WSSLFSLIRRHLLHLPPAQFDVGDLPQCRARVQPLARRPRVGGDRHRAAPGAGIPGEQRLGAVVQVDQHALRTPIPAWHEVGARTATLPAPASVPFQDSREPTGSGPSVLSLGGMSTTKRWTQLEPRSEKLLLDVGGGLHANLVVVRLQECIGLATAQ